MSCPGQVVKLLRVFKCVFRCGSKSLTRAEISVVIFLLIRFEYADVQEVLCVHRVNSRDISTCYFIVVASSVVYIIKNYYRSY